MKRCVLVVLLLLSAPACAMRTKSPYMSPHAEGVAETLAADMARIHFVREYSGAISAYSLVVADVSEEGRAKPVGVLMAGMSAHYDVDPGRYWFVSLMSTSGDSYAIKAEVDAGMEYYVFFKPTGFGARFPPRVQKGETPPRWPKFVQSHVNESGHSWYVNNEPSLVRHAVTGRQKFLAEDDKYRAQKSIEPGDGLPAAR